MIVLSHKTAYLFWRQYTGDIRTLKPLQRRNVTKPKALPLEALAHLGIPATKEHPVDLLFFSRESRLQHACVHEHLQPEPLPAGSLLRLSDEVGIVSPELCFTQVAKKTSVEYLTLIGCELCGTYALVGPSRTYAERPSLTSAAALQKYALAMNSAGRSRACEAAAFVPDGAGSPMEAKLALLLTLPTTKGGFALPAPKLNASIPLGPEARALYNHKTCRGDLFWENARLDVEYDGEDAHTGEMHAKDVARAAALKAEGVEVLTLTAAQLYNQDAFAQLAKLIGARVGKPLRIRVRNFDTRQANLRRELGL